MRTRSLFYRSIVAAVLLATGGIASAADVNEAELNNTLATAQNLSIPAEGVTVHGWIGSLNDPYYPYTQDVDFYSFHAQAGDNVTFDIDIGIGGAMSVGTTLAVFDQYGMVKAQNFDYPPGTNAIDPGSVSSEDAYLTVHFATSGTYKVGVLSYGVTGLPRTFGSGGMVSSSWGTIGDYELVITGATPEVTTPEVTVKQISIEVKPGDNTETPVNPKSHGKIPVALLSESDFNAMDVDESSLTFGATGDEHSLYMCHKNGMDVNGDGLPDKVCLFDTQTAGFSATDVMGTAKGRLLSPLGAAGTRGMAFEGKGYLKVVPNFSH